MMLKYKKTTIASAFLLSLAALVSCGGAQDPLLFKPGAGPSVPAGSEPSQNDTANLSPDEMAAEGPCIPAVPVSGQTIIVSEVGEDPWAENPDEPGASYLPQGSTQLTYTFDQNSFVVDSSERLAWIPDPVGEYDQTTGIVTTNYSAILENPETESIIALNPSDWAQQLARKLHNKIEGDTATIQLTLKARGRLPLLLATLAKDLKPEIASEIDVQKETLLATYQVTATRMANGTQVVGGSSIPVCNFSFTIDRPYQVKDPALLSQGVHGPYEIGTLTDSPPWNLTLASEQAAIAPIGLDGAVLKEYFDLDSVSSRLYIEPYIPSFKGNFSTSNEVPFVPVELSWEHTYGVSALTSPSYKNSDGEENSKIIKVSEMPSPFPARQKFTYVSSSS